MHKIIFSESPEAPIGSEVLIQDDHDASDSISSIVTQKGQIDFYKTFSLNVTMYKDKKDTFLVSFSKIFIYLTQSRKNNEN